MGGFKKQKFFRFFKYFLQKTKNFNDFLKKWKNPAQSAISKKGISESLGMV
jgi:hypothetical protein